ncbi:MAG: ComEC family competence protein [Sediminimonas qiaohouensis]|uniref:ComEC family competence protein n=1 Tax=Sediminimonas qiaohouensis TaxID=552061 RepID=A0A7C9HBI6_9RHOB|nr:ComEC/Rec2 family competence protein [Sediminimonas qiaohouensis]MTJ05291.1 ComEC family competence protein [Sediminimonas qiaohouensis]
MRISAAIGSAFLRQRGHLFPWAPVCLAVGIGGYFAAPAEPGAVFYAAAAVGAMALAVLAWRSGPEAAPILIALALILAGLCLAGARAHMVAAPVLEWRYYGPIAGRIVAVDRSSSDAVRLTLDGVVLEDTPPVRTPRRVRVSLHGQQGYFVPEPGQRVAMTGHLAPPSGAVEPGGFDFRRHAWFARLGAIGYTRAPAVLMRAAPRGAMVLARARMALSARVQAALPGETGAFAAVIMTGDRSGIGQETLEALRISNLAHLLAISGLHMGLLAGVVLGALRLLFAAVPVVGLRVPARKLSAGGALLAAAGYLALSGGNVATERAFVMVAVMLCAVIVDRRAISLRAVAVAAIVVLLLRPEALLGPGFQMSFAATTALVAVFGWLRGRAPGRGPGWARPVLAVVLSSAVAGLATAPVAAAHFNQFARYGLLANLLSVPMMGALVMPAAVLAAALMPLGLEAPALWVMGGGLDWILELAHRIAALPHARGAIVSPGAGVLPLLAVGALWGILWQGRARLVGLVPMVAALALWMQAERPMILISGDGGLVGVMTPQGRALSRERGSSFVARNWLENDGDTADQAAAAARWSEPITVPGGGRLIHARGKRGARDLSCDAGDWAVLNVPASNRDLPCRVIDAKSLRQSGALALGAGDTWGEIRRANDVAGLRLWSRQGDQ